MSPIGMAFIFGLLAVAAAYGLWRSFATGVTSDELYTFREDENPAGFMAVTAGKMFVLVFGVAARRTKWFSEPFRVTNAASLSERPWGRSKHKCLIGVRDDFDPTGRAWPRARSRALPENPSRGG